MILAALILQAAAPQSAVDAERAFAAAAQAEGQWTAFREFAAEDATMFVPQPINAQARLKDRKDPAKSVTWWPTASYVSCDGKLAVNTGGWKLPDGTVGFFSTVWRKAADGSWKWIVDGGDALAKPRPRPDEPVVRVAHCSVPPAWEDDVIFTCPDTAKCGHEDAAGDGTLTWSWAVYPDGRRSFDAALWDGKRYAPVVGDKIAGEAK